MTGGFLAVSPLATRAEAADAAFDVFAARLTSLERTANASTVASLLPATAP